MDDNALQRLLLESAVERDGRRTLSCTRAFEMHRQYHVALAEIGRLCDENDIRICACQLGCFR